MYIHRDSYLEKLINHEGNGLVKILTGVRRCGKSFLLFTMFYDYLRSQGVDDNHIIRLELDRGRNASFRNPIELGKYLRAHMVDKEKYYIMLDEVQFVTPVPNPVFIGSGLSVEDIPKITLFDVVNDFMHDNTDIYMTGSNSKMLSKDLVTEFRGRDDQILVMPLSFQEYFEHVGGDRTAAWNDYVVFGGMPGLLGLNEKIDKMNYLRQLFTETYIKDITARYKVEKDDILSDIIDILCSSIGSLTSANKLVNTLNTVKKANVSYATVQRYIDYILDAMLFNRAKQYNIKGKKHIDSTIKYYAVDPGLRNARLAFRQVEETHLMENIVYNELIRRGYAVDVGVVDLFDKDDTGKTRRSSCEIDFIATIGSERIYIQSAFALSTSQKQEQESRSLLRTGDGFKKIIIERSDIASGLYDNDGIRHIGLLDFLMGEQL